MVADLMKSLFRLFAVTCTYCNAAIDALTPVNNARLFSRLLMAKRSEEFAALRKFK
jgi:hypothetical protein